MLVVPHHEVRIEPARPLVARDDVGADLFVRRPQMGAAVDVIDGGCDVVTWHGYFLSALCSQLFVSRYALFAVACTSFTGTLRSDATRRQSSNSGAALTIVSPRRATLNRMAPRGV